MDFEDMLLDGLKIFNGVAGVMVVLLFFVVTGIYLYMETTNALNNFIEEIHYVD